MEAITFSPAQVHVFNLVSHIKSDLGLDKLRAQSGLSLLPSMQSK